MKGDTPKFAKEVVVESSFFGTRVYECLKHCQTKQGYHVRGAQGQLGRCAQRLFPSDVLS